MNAGKVLRPNALHPLEYRAIVILYSLSWLGGQEHPMSRTRGFSFDLQRAIQATGVVLRDRGPMDRIRLLKILYFASRDALQDAGKPIIGGRASALDHGPLHSEVYNNIKGEANDAEWRTFFENTGHTIRLKHGADPGRLDLSPYEIDLLNRRAEWAEQFETFDLSQESHKLAEWQKNVPEIGSSLPIYVEDLLEAVGIIGDDAVFVLNENASQAKLLSLAEAVS